MPDTEKSTVYEFAEFRLDTASRRLFERETNTLLPIQPKALAVLLFFIENEGRILTKNEILETVWAERFVEESNLSQTIFVLRKTLNDDPKNPRFIVTVPNHGYRFIAKVDKVSGTAEQAAAKAEISDSGFQPAANDIRKTPDKGQRTGTLKYLFAAALILLAGLGIYYFRQAKKLETIREIKSVAVLPFKNIGGREAEEYLGGGLAEVLASKLSNIKTIIVRPPGTVLRYAEPSPDPQKIGRELNVEAVVMGSVQKVDENIRVTVQLVRVSDGATLWAETFDDKFTNFFAVQDSISRKATESLSLKLTSDEREQIAKSYTTNPEAYQLYLQGLFLWNKRTPQTLTKAIEEFEKAKQIDPNFALAYVGLANCYVLLAEYRVMSPNESFPKARSAVAKALEIDGRLAEARTAMAYILAFYDWDFPAAEREFKKAIEQNPNDATAHQWYAEFLQVLGKFDESLTELERAEQIAPTSLIIKTDLARYFYFTRQYDKSLEQSYKIIEIDPNFGWGYGFLWVSYKEKGLLKESVEAHMKAESMFGRSEPEMIARRTAFAEKGWKGYWEKWLEQSDAPPVRAFIQDIERAIIYNEIRDTEKTLEYLQKSFERREHWLLYIKYAPQFDNLQSEPRFVSLLKRIGLS